MLGLCHSANHSSLSTQCENVLEADENVSWHIFSGVHLQTVAVYCSASSGRSALASDESLTQTNSHMLLVCGASHVGSSTDPSVHTMCSRGQPDRVATTQPAGILNHPGSWISCFSFSLSHSCAACASWLNDSSLSDYQELNCLFTLGVFLPYVQYVLCVCAGNWMFLQYWFLQYSVSNFLFVFVYKMETLKLCFIIIIFYLSYPCPRPRISILKYERSL